MIKFRNAVVKVIFWVIYSFISLIIILGVTNEFRDPSESIDFTSVFSASFSTAFITWLLVLVFTVPTESKKRPGKKVRLGNWIPVGTFVVFGLFAGILMGIQTNQRCAVIGPQRDLSNCNFSGQDFSGSDLHGAEMQWVNFKGSNLNHANLSGADLSYGNFETADLTGANLSNAKLLDANLKDADLSMANLNGAIIDRATFYNVKGLTNEMLSNLGSWVGVLFEKEEEMYSQLSEVCNGVGVHTAANYSPGSGMNSMLFFNVEGERYHYVAKDMPESWRPESSNNVELVACIGDRNQVLLETCKYEGGNKTLRYSIQIDITIFEAKTGNLVEEITLLGSTPDRCPEDMLVVEGPVEEEIVGSAPSGKDFVNAFAPFINENGVINPPNAP